MPQRPRQHLLEDMARSDLHRIFTEFGWAVEDLSKDYGEDLLVRIFDAGHATPMSIFIQSKATDSLRTVVREERNFVSIKLSTNHLTHWRKFWQPVVLTVFETQSRNTYWEVIQDVLSDAEYERSMAGKKTISLYIPLTNKLDADGLRRLGNRTRTRFERFKSQKEGAEIVMRHVQESTGLKLSYDPEAGILAIPKGQFIPEEPEGLQVVTFGRTASRLQSLCERTGLSAEGVMHEALETLSQVAKGFRDGYVLQIRDKDGQVVEQWNTETQLNDHLKRIDDESDEY